MNGGLQALVRHALNGLGPDGRFRPGEVAALREAVSRRPLNAPLPDHPADLFGPWEAIPPPAQEGLRRTVEQAISRVMAFCRSWGLMSLTALSMASFTSKACLDLEGRKYCRKSLMVSDMN